MCVYSSSIFGLLDSLNANFNAGIPIKVVKTTAMMLIVKISSLMVPLARPTPDIINPISPLGLIPIPFLRESFPE